jgi:hypothetical protein
MAEAEVETPTCPFCSGNSLLMMDDDDLFYILCLECRACGPVEDTADEALFSWTYRADPEAEKYLLAQKCYTQ